MLYFNQIEESSNFILANNATRRVGRLNCLPQSTRKVAFLFKDMINCETELVKYLQDGNNWKKHFPKFKLLGFEVPIFGCISGRRIGIVDIVFYAYSNKYLVEVKFDKNSPSGDFFDSLKILGYVESYNMFHFNKESKPVVMLNKSIMKYDYRAILGSLNISWISFDINENQQIDFQISIIK